VDNPILNPPARQHSDPTYSEREVGLANRNSGTLLETLHEDVTPVGAHYLLNHFDIPRVETADNWQLSLHGCFEKPQTVLWSQLHALPRITQRVTLECAGNGRRLIEPRWPSQPWGVEAVGTADWTGVPLSSVLALASPDDNCREIVFHGSDVGVDGGKIHNFARSLSVDKAMHKEVMLAFEMNGQPLAPQHGFPLRLIVPGWYGMASVKWLSAIEGIDHGFQGHQQVGTYVYREQAGDEGTPVTEIRVRSLLVPPGIPDWSTRRRLVKPGRIKITGRAWCGGGVPVARVALGANDHWVEATLHPSTSPYAWRRWEAEWEATEGHHLLRCRATDANGNEQPLNAKWDMAGFGNNSVQQVEIWCEDY
jgi:DMSO/TMAO reductase YedYZ molybdopterin-dependent catalytic subunit